MSRTRIYGRTLARSQALQLLFQAEASGRSVDDVLAGEYVLSRGPLDPYAEQLARGAGAHLPELDRVLAHAAKNWSLSRMSAVDRNLLRLSLYELLFVDDVEPAVTISECVEIAKAFGSSDTSSKFVNGILGRIQSDIEAGTDVIEEARKLDAEEAAAYEREAQESSERYGDEDHAYGYGYGPYDDDPYGYGDAPYVDTHPYGYWDVPRDGEDAFGENGEGAPSADGEAAPAPEGEPAPEPDAEADAAPEACARPAGDESSSDVTPSSEAAPVDGEDN